MELIPYSNDALASALENDFTSANVIKGKNHFIYLTEYLGDVGINARTILIERDYVSKDYLIDYTSYYSLCFTDYQKRCKRVHFFNCEIVEEDFQNFVLSEGDEGRYNDSYLGFIVVKPIPSTVIGYTVLKNYELENGDILRNYWGG